MKRILPSALLVLWTLALGLGTAPWTAPAQTTNPPGTLNYGSSGYTTNSPGGTNYAGTTLTTNPPAALGWGALPGVYSYVIIDTNGVILYPTNFALVNSFGAGGAASNFLSSPTIKAAKLNGSNIFFVVGGLTNDTTGNAATATVATGLADRKSVV